MQHISPSWHCKRKTRRGPSNRLTTNLLCLAALLLLALMPRVGWAQTTTRSVATAKQLRAALEDQTVTYIELTNDIRLDNGHETGINQQPYNSLYLVVGKKTIKGNDFIIQRWNNYPNNSIALTAGAELVIEDLILDGNFQENYASMVVVPDTVATWKREIGGSGSLTKQAVNGRLKMKRCTIQNCRLKTISPQEFKIFDDARKAYLDGLVTDNTGNIIDTYSFSAYHNSGGAGVNFQPAKTASGTADNTIILDSCIFLNNEITPTQDDFDRQIGGALALMGEKAMGGTIKDCTFQKNYAPNAGGAIAFFKTLLNNREFNFTGTNTIGGPPVNNEDSKNSSGADGGGILIEGGKVVIDGQANISYNTAGNMGGGISLRGGWLHFQSSTNNDSVQIHHNKAGHITNNGNGGGIFVEPLSVNDYMELSNNPNVKLTISNNTCKGITVNNESKNGFGGGIYIGGGGDDQDIWEAQKHKVTLVSASTNPNDNKRILITDNEAGFDNGIDSRGGGISVRQNVVATFTKCIIKGNKAKGSGGGISLYSSKATFNGCLIEENHARSDINGKFAYGGGVSVESFGDNQFIGGTIRYNGYDTITQTHNGGGVSINANGKVVFNGNDNTYGRCHIYQNIAIDGGGGLYMDSDDGKLIGNCYVEDNTATNGGGIYYKSGGFKNTNYVYSNIADNGGGVYVDIGKSKELKGLVIGSNVVAANVDQGNRAQLGGGIYAKVTSNDSTLTINGCKIVHNKWQSHDANNHTDIIKGGGLYMSESSNYTVDLKGGTIIEYNEATDGGGVYVSDDATSSDNNLILQLTNASLSYNKATTRHGGGIYNDKKVVQSSDTLITLNGNKALAGNGGGIYNDGTCTLINCRIGQSGNGNGNSAKNGGGLYNCNYRTTNLGGTTTFENNNATNDGGGIYNNWQVTQMGNSTLAFVNDTATRNGGGVYHTKGIEDSANTDLTLYGATFKGNHAVENGGGIYTNHTCILDSCHIGQSGDGNGNSAKNGGGIYKGKKEMLFAGGMLTISGGEVSNNTASNNGGGIYLEKADTYVNDSCLIQWNKATNDGGGIYLNGQHGFQPGNYGFSSCAILKNDGVTEGPPIDGALRVIVDYPNNNITLIEFGVVGGTVNIGADGKIPYLKISYYIAQTPDIVTGDYFLLRLEKENSNAIVEVKCEVGGYNQSFLGSHYYHDGTLDNPDYIESVPEISSLITLNGCTVGGETNKGNEALAGNGGGIYISPNATAIMTSDGTSTAYSNGIRNDVTHNKAKQKAGGVYKDGTLKVEGHVVITENTAEHSTGGGKSADGSGQPEAGAIPAGTAAEKEE